jgi:hypothetical protein
MANKIKTAFGLLVAVLSFVVLPVQLVAWAEDLAAEKAREAELRMEGRVDALQSTTQAAHNYDFYEVRQQQVEDDLIELEEAEAAGEDLTPTELRKKEKLEESVKKFEEAKNVALQQLKGEVE